MSEDGGMEFEALFVMMNRLSRDIEPRLRKLGISSTGYLALQMISRRKGSFSRPPIRSELARSIGTTPASMSVLVARLVRTGLVNQFPRNDQSCELSLTPKGKLKLEKAAKIWRDSFAVVSAELGVTMKERLLKGVAKLNLINENKEIEALFVRSSKLFRGDDSTAKRYRKQAKANLESHRERYRARERALDES